MKTAIEMLVEDIETKHSDILYQYPILLANIDKYLETEKQQIIEAVKYGQNNHSISISHEERMANDYYTSTFTTNKETLK